MNRMLSAILLVVAALVQMACDSGKEPVHAGDNEALVGGVKYAIRSNTYREPDGSFYINGYDADSSLFVFSAYVKPESTNTTIDLSEWQDGVHYDFSFAFDGYCSFSQTNSPGGLFCTYNGVNHDGVSVFPKGRLTTTLDDNQLTYEINAMMVNSDEFRLRVVVPLKQVTQL